MKEYIIKIEDSIDAKLQYLIGQAIPLSPTTLRGSTVAEILQAIIDDRLQHICLIADSVREKELIAAVKADATLLTAVEAKCDEIKTAKALAEAPIEEIKTP